MSNTHSLELSDANNSHVSIASNTNFEITTSNDRTFEAWVKIVTAKNIAGIFTRWGNEGGANKNFLVRLDSSRKVQVYAGSGAATGATVTGSTSLTVGTWHHVAVTWSGSTDDKFRIYIDGVLDGTLSGTASPGAATSSLVMGGRDNLSGIDSDIKIDDVRIWSTQRSVTEIADNRSAELAGTETGLLEYWKLNNDLTNSVSGGGSGSLTNNNSGVFSTDVPFSGASGGTAFSQAVVII